MPGSTTISIPIGSDLSQRRPRGRPREFDTTEALRKATLVFWEKGYHATSLDDLIKATGIQKSSLYAAFGDKGSLFSACLDRYEELLCDAEIAALKRGSTPPEALGNFLRQAIIEVTRTRGPAGCLIVCVLSELALTQNPLRRRLKELIAATDKVIAQHLEATGFKGHCINAGRIASTIALGYAVRARSGESRTSLLKTIPRAVSSILSV